MSNTTGSHIQRRQTQCTPLTAAQLPQLPNSWAATLAKILANRAINDPEQLQPRLNQLHPPQQLSGLNAAVERLRQALTAGQRILVIGDYDADGATSSALACHALRKMGAAWIHYLVPDRFKLGYGLSPALVQQALSFKPGLLITVDNGIASLDGVAAANAHNIDVIITDHHLPGEQLPDACAIVNPNLDNDPFPSKHLAGVGVIFYLLSALRSALRTQGWFQQNTQAPRQEPNMADYLDLVAIGTVADLVPLDANNRILVEQGLRRIRAGKARPGIQALIQAAGRQAEQLVTNDIAFAIGPRLNAAGRLDDMSLGIECLLSAEFDAALPIATRLDQLNQERRSIEQDMRDQAIAQLDQLQLQQDPLPDGLCLYQENWHEGIVGILASRIKERHHRPSICFARSEDGEQLKGSARSIPGLHLRDLIANIDTQNPGLITRFGGHAMAAGLSLPEAHYSQFQSAFESAVSEQLDNSQRQAIVATDGPLPADAYHQDFAATLRQLLPWGQGCPSPLFDDHFTILSRRTVGDGRHLKLIVQPQNTELKLDAICFHYEDPLPPQNARIHLAYQLDLNHFRGETQIQLIIERLELGA